jgi:trehalose-6-phosphate synthase
MTYKAKVCSDIRTKHSTQSERHLEFLNVKPWWYVKKLLGVKRLKSSKGIRNKLSKFFVLKVTELMETVYGDMKALWHVLGVPTCC